MKITAFICDECGKDMRDPGYTFTKNKEIYNFCSVECREQYIYDLHKMKEEEDNLCHGDCDECTTSSLKRHRNNRCTYD